MSSTHDHPPLVEARLHQRDVERILNSAPTPALRTAWQEGTLPAKEEGTEYHQQRHRFLVKEGRASDDRSHDGTGIMKALSELYDEGREWFEEADSMANVRYCNCEHSEGSASQWSESP